MKTARVDLFSNTYRNFSDQVLADIRAETYGRDIGQNSWLTVDEYENFIDSLKLRFGARVLEVASGSGGPALHLARRRECTLVGIDVNPEAILTATRAASSAALSSRVTFRRADATEPLPFPDDSFDALLCIDSMNHFPDRGYSLKEWRRVLKPGGRAVFTDPVVITGAVTDEELIVKAGFRIVSQTDATENAALVSRRWREARQRFRDDLLRIEGEERFEGVQKFLGAVHKLTDERRLSRIAWVVEKTAN